MTVRFILGRAGTGKTTVCVQEIVRARERGDDGPPLILLVPEQATFQMEQAILREPGVVGLAGIEVLSFQRLAWRSLAEVGGDVLPHLTDLGRHMLLRRALQEREGQLRLFQRSAKMPGFIDKLARTFKELKAYQKRPEDLYRQHEVLVRLGQEHTLISHKLHDLALVQETYEKLVQDRFVDPNDQLGKLVDIMPDVSFLSDAEIWVDGFAGFTLEEYAVLKGLFQKAKRVHIALCLDPDTVDDLGTVPGGLDELSLFHPTEDTYVRLQDLRREVGIPQEATVNLAGPKRFHHQALLHIEKHLFDYPTVPLDSPDGDGLKGLHLVEAPHPRAEVEAVAGEILRLSREQGWRFRDMAVICRDLDMYENTIATVFADFDIPYFIDVKRSIVHHPVVELLRAVLEIFESDWAYEPVFRFFKTDLTPLHRVEVDMLENYVLEHGIVGRRWYDSKPWTFRRRLTLDDAEGFAKSVNVSKMNDIRGRGIKALLRAQRRFRQAGRDGETFSLELTRVVYDLLVELGVPDRLEAWADEAESTGDLIAAREHAQVWDGIVNVLEELADAGGCETLSAYREIMETGLSSLRLGLIPPSLDQVLVGSVDRSRKPHIRAAFVIGVNEGVFPPVPDEDVIIHDDERELLMTSGFELGPTSRVRLFHEQYLSYIALTRASKKLWVSYPVRGGSGKTMRPSALFGRLRQAFPTAPVDQVTELGHLVGETPAMPTPEALAGYLTRRLRTAEEDGFVSSGLATLYSWTLTHPDIGPEVRPLLKSLGYHNHIQPLSADLVERMFGDELRTSVTGLETYRACPFKYFASQALRLSPRRLFVLDNMQLGVLSHATLRIVMERLATMPADLGELSESDIRTLVDEAVDELAPRLNSEILLSSARYHYVTRSLKRTLTESLKAMRDYAAVTPLRPVAFELAFGRENDPLSAGRFDLGRNRRLVLRGVIDRVDAALSGNRRFVTIIDYKAGRRRLDLDRVIDGLTLQLIVYAARVESEAERLFNQDASVMAMLYFPLQDPILPLDPTATEEVRAREMQKRHRMAGLVRDDDDTVPIIHTSCQGSSPYVPISVKKDGDLSANSSKADPDQWRALFKFAEGKMAETAHDILDGKIEVSPYKRGETETACQWCDYRSVCRFDALVPGNNYRPVKTMKPDEAWQQMMRGEAR